MSASREVESEAALALRWAGANDAANEVVPPANSRNEAPYSSLYSPLQRWGFLSILFLVTTSNYVDQYILSVLLEPIKQEFHVSDTQLGLLSGFSFALCYAAAALPIARWADVGNRRTVIALAIAGWSLMTAVCGLAQSFWQLVAARLGVGAMEPGAAPPSQSLTVDYFPADRRAMALAVLSMGGSAVGWIIGVGLGGYVAALYGWRVAFLVAGIPGILLALLVQWCLPEPRTRDRSRADIRPTGSVWLTLRQLRAKKSFVLALCGISIYAVFAYGVSIFLPSFMMRSLHATLEQVSVSWAFAIAAANLIGAVAGAWLADRLSRRTISWYGWLPAVSFLLGVPLYWSALSAHGLWSFIPLDFVAEAVLATGVPMCFTLVHAVCGDGRRSMAIAIVHFSFMLFGSGLGPLVAGALSDALMATYAAESLRYSLVAMLSFLVPAAVMFYLAGRALPAEREDSV